MIQFTTQSSDIFSDLTARYFIAQHMPDLMRKETRNIGVVVQKGNAVAARFLGERDDDETLDGRALKTFKDAQVYKMWVRHWRKELEGEDWKSKLLDSGKITFNFIPGGEVTDTGTDTARDIASYLYSMLVSDGGLKEALDLESEQAVAEIRSDIRSELRRLEVMKSVAPEWVKNPVLEDQEVRGVNGSWHRLAFLQSSPRQSWAFEPLNLITPLKQHVRERACYLAYVFNEIRRFGEIADHPVNTTAVIRVNDDYRYEPHVKYALSVVENNANVVDWTSKKARDAFLNERLEAAVAV